MTYEEAYRMDLALLYKSKVAEKKLLKRLRRIEEDRNWAQSYDYHRPRSLEEKKRVSVWLRIKSLVKCLIP